MRAAGCGACAAILALAAGDAFAQSSAQPSAQSSWFASTPQSNGHRPAIRGSTKSLCASRRVCPTRWSRISICSSMSTRPRRAPRATHVCVQEDERRRPRASLRLVGVHRTRALRARRARHEQSSFTPKGYFEIDPSGCTPTTRRRSGTRQCPMRCFSTGSPMATRPDSRYMGPPKTVKARSARAPVPDACDCRSTMRTHSLIWYAHSSGTDAKTRLPRRLLGCEQRGSLSSRLDGPPSIGRRISVLVLVDDYGGENRVTSLY